MKTSFKKAIAGVSIFALIAMNAFTGSVSGANANPSFDNSNPNGVDDVVVVTIPADVIAENTDNVTLYVRDQAGAGVDVSGWTVGNTDVNATLDDTSANVGELSFNNVIDATVDVTFEMTPNDIGNYTVSVIGTAGVGSSILYVGGANQVSVSATVLPILSMTLTNTALEFGELSVDSLNTTTESTTVEASTNATDGFQISLASLNAALESENLDRIEYSSDVLDATNNVDEFYNFLLGNANNVTLVNTNNFANITAANAPVVIANTGNAPVTGANFTVQPQAGITTNTAAGNYSDTLTFSITGNF